MYSNSRKLKYSKNKVKTAWQIMKLGTIKLQQTKAVFMIVKVRILIVFFLNTSKFGNTSTWIPINSLKDFRTTLDCR